LSIDPVDENHQVPRLTVRNSNARSFIGHGAIQSLVIQSELEI
jgi:hypothetical protein